MSEKTYTEQEVNAIAVRAAEIALAQRPVPSTVTVGEAAKMLNVSPRTIIRMNMKRNSVGRIPYEEVIAARAAR